jgi:uncharacterized delta-60 repeat protein
MKKRNQYCRVICSFIFLLCMQHHGWAQPGEPDSSFNGNGIVSYAPMAAMAFANAVQTDGKLLVTGYLLNNSSTDILIVRYNEDGTPDNSFGQKGIVISDFGRSESSRAITVQTDGKILVAGVIQYGNLPDMAFLARYQANGMPDSSFGINGNIIAGYSDILYGAQQYNSVKVLPDGKILVNGSRGDINGYAFGYTFIAKYQPNGVLDNSFANDGILQTLTGVAGKESFDIQNDGKIIVAGSTLSNGKFSVLRYLPNGQPDMGFNNTGIAETFVDSLGGGASVIKLQPDDKILMAGIVNRWYGPNPTNDNGYDFVTVRYNTNGTIDSSFGSNGIVFNHFNLASRPSQIVLQEGGKILLAGSTASNLAAEGDYVLVRCQANGKADSSFGNNGSRIYPNYGACYAMALKDHRIFLSGWALGGVSSSTGFYTLAIQNDGVSLSSSSIDLCPGAASAVLPAGVSGTSYQWQVSADGVVFTNIGNDTYYSGVNSSNLFLNNIPSSFDGYKYRCITTNGTSDIFTIRFVTTWTGAVSNDWNDSGNWSCQSVPDSNMNVIIYSGSVIVNMNVSVKSLTIKKEAVVSVSSGHVLHVLNNN